MNFIVFSFSLVQMQVSDHQSKYVYILLMPLHVFNFLAMNFVHVLYDDYY